MAAISALNTVALTTEGFDVDFGTWMVVGMFWFTVFELLRILIILILRLARIIMNKCRKKGEKKND